MEGGVGPEIHVGTTPPGPTAPESGARAHVGWSRQKFRVAILGANQPVWTDRFVAEQNQAASWAEEEEEENHWVKASRVRVSAR